MLHIRLLPAPVITDVTALDSEAVMDLVEAIDLDLEHRPRTSAPDWCPNPKGPMPPVIDLAFFRYHSVTVADTEWIPTSSLIELRNALFEIACAKGDEEAAKQMSTSPTGKRVHADM